MGQSVKIADLAEKMIRLSGLEPGKDITIKYTGLRPGEKIFEELLNTKENTLPTYHPQIMIARVGEYGYEEIKNQTDQLLEIARKYDNYEIVRQMKAIVPEFKSQNSVYEKLDNPSI
jgi:FlaA1/EpsC-like NDP-sugar epimerase